MSVEMKRRRFLKVLPVLAAGAAGVVSVKSQVKPQVYFFERGRIKAVPLKGLPFPVLSAAQIRELDEWFATAPEFKRTR